MLKNPRLYRFLYQLSGGRIKVHNENEEARIAYGDEIPKVTDWGECYSIPCPFCRDVGSHAWFCHLWGESINGYEVYPATCYLPRGCFTRKENRQYLIEEYRNFSASSIGADLSYQVTPGIDPDHMDLPEWEFPPDYVTVDCLPSDHPAVRFLVKKGFTNMAYLSNDFSIGITDKIPGRIVVPVRFRDKISTYSARDYVGQKPKYLYSKGAKTSWMLFNYDNAIMHDDFVVVVEGVFDVIALAPYLNQRIVAIFGTNISEVQWKLLEHWQRIFLWFDPDAFDKAKSLASKRKNISAMKFSKGDPDELNPRQRIILANHLSKICYGELQTARETV